MSKTKGLYYSSEVIVFPLLLLLLIAIIFWIESKFNVNFNYLGIYPREIKGLRGILFSPFIHGSSKHLLNNSVPLFVLTSALFYFYRSIRWKVLIYGTILTGFLTWIIGRPSLHIGASGVIYMLTSFLLFRGIFSKQYQLTALSFVVIFLYGGFIWYVFPVDEKISWEGHLSGLLIGLLFALLFNNDELKNKKYLWEKDSYNPENDVFMQHFDEDGNFIEKSTEIEETEEVSKNKIKINYIITTKKSKENKEL